MATMVQMMSPPGHDPDRPFDTSVSSRLHHWSAGHKIDRSRYTTPSLTDLPLVV